MDDRDANCWPWRASRLAVVLSAGSLVSVSAALADSVDDAQRPQLLAQRFVEAVMSKSAERRMAIVHPRSIACMNPQTQPYFDWIFSRQARLVTGARPRVIVTSVPEVPAVLPTDGRSDYPIRPVYQIQIDFITDPYKSSSVVLFAARDGQQWREVLPCPRGDVASRARDRQFENRQRAKATVELPGTIPSALRTEILALLSEGRKVQAIRRYSAATGVDISTSKDVVESLIVGNSAK